MKAKCSSLQTDVAIKTVGSIRYGTVGSNKVSQRHQNAFEGSQALKVPSFFDTAKTLSNCWSTDKLLPNVK